MLVQKRKTRRAGYSLLEVLLVLAILIALGGILAPMMTTFSRDTKVKAASDAIMGRIADARASAIERGMPYRLAISEDGQHVRIAPDDQSFASQAATTDEDEGPLVAEEMLPTDVLVSQVLDDSSTPTVTDQAGWHRIATFLPDGTCREDLATIQVKEPGVYPILIRIRGLTGSATLTSGTQQGTNR